MTGHVVGANNQTSTDGVYNYTYDDEGNRTRRTKISDGSYTDYSWDHRNRLVKVEHKTSAGVVTAGVDLVYNALNRLIKEVIDADGVGSRPALDRYFSWVGDQIALQWDENASTSAIDLTHRYLWGPMVDQLLADEAVTSLSSPGAVRWALTDHLGTVRDLVSYDAVTDTTTNIKHRTLDGFGNITSDSAPSVQALFGFQGTLHEITIGHNYHRERWYDPQLGKWVSQDPIGFAAGDANLARMVENSPTYLTDPDGLSPVGHHWVPVSVITEFAEEMTDAAYELAMGATSGPTDPPHCYGTYGGVSHHQYNELVRSNLRKYMTANKIKKLSQAQMLDFIQKIEAGQDYRGRTNKDLTAFNNAIRAERQAYLKGGPNRGFRTGDGIAELRKRGRAYMKSPRFWATVAGAMALAAASEAIAQGTEGLECASKSESFKTAVRHLAQGNLSAADQSMMGRNQGPGFYHDLMGSVGDKAASNFEKAWNDAIENAASRTEQLKRRFPDSSRD